MQSIERRNVVRAAMLADRRSPEGKEAWRRALRSAVHEQQQLGRSTTATEVYRILLEGVSLMARAQVDEDVAAQHVVAKLKLAW